MPESIFVSGGTRGAWKILRQTAVKGDGVAAVAPEWRHVAREVEIRLEKTP